MWWKIKFAAACLVAIAGLALHASGAKDAVILTAVGGLYAGKLLVSKAFSNAVGSGAEKAILPHVNFLWRLLFPLIEGSKISGLKFDSFIADPFVSGYVTGVIGGYQSTPEYKNLGRLKQGGIISKLSDEFGHNIFKPARKFMDQPAGRNPDFDRGVANGVTVVKFALGDTKIEDHPDVLEANEGANMEYSTEHLVRTANAVRAGGPDPVEPEKVASREEVLLELIENLFLDVIRGRFASR